MLLKHYTPAPSGKRAALTDETIIHPGPNQETPNRDEHALPRAMAC